MYSLTLTYLGAPIARLAALADLTAGSGVEVRVAAVGSKWDDGGELPLTRTPLGEAEQPRLELSESSSLGVRGLLEWPATLPLGELLQLRLRSAELDELRVWARVEGIRVHRRSTNVDPGSADQRAARAA